jgi:hypothetical protein
LLDGHFSSKIPKLVCPNLFSLHTLKIFGGFKFPKGIFITKTVEGKNARVRMHNLVTGRDDMKKKRGKKGSPTTDTVAVIRRERERETCTGKKEHLSIFLIIYKILRHQILIIPSLQV